MFKFRRLLCAVLVCALVGVAYGAATKIRSFTTWNEPPGADGMAIMNVADSQGMVLLIIVSGFTPNTQYVPAFFDGVNDHKLNQYFMTDDKGNAHWNVEAQTLYPWPNLRLYYCFYTGEPNPVCELRAEGNP